MDTCSEIVRRALQWLAAYVESAPPHDEVARQQWRPPVWSASGSLLFYVLSIVESPWVQEYERLSAADPFWDGLEPDDGLSFFFLQQLGLSEDPRFGELFRECIVDVQMATGFLPNEHCDSLRALVSLSLYPETTNRAVDYLLPNWNDFRVHEVAVGMLALQELDCIRYGSVLQAMSEALVASQRADGSIGEGDIVYDALGDTCLTIMALSRMPGVEEAMGRAVDFVRRQANADGSWGVTSIPGVSGAHDTALAILALVSVGEGPKVSKALVEWDRTLSCQRSRAVQAHFLHTSPLYRTSLHVRQLHDKIIQMLADATRSVRICSLYIDMLYEHVIQLAEQKSVAFSIVVRPRADVRGVRERIAKNVLDLLQTATRGNVRTNEMVHARLLIVDDDEVLVSSVDLTRDQLFDEYNAGVWTRDPSIVAQALDFFNNVWEASAPLS